MTVSFGKPASAGLHPEPGIVEASSIDWFQSKIAGKVGVDRTAASGNFGLNPTFRDLEVLFYSMLPIGGTSVYGLAVMSNVARQRLLLGVSALLVIAVILLPRIPQDPAYLDYADKRSLFGIPNAADVLTNLLFAWVGARGLYLLARPGRLQLQSGLESAYAVFFASLVLVGAASAYFHWSPDFASLALDRLPIAFIFMSFFTLMLGEWLSFRFARRLFAPLIVTGAASVAWWYYSELAGYGDLRVYLLVQLLPMVLIPLMLLVCEPRYSRGSDIWWLLAWFIAARVCEVLDRQIFDSLGFVSGHSLKHIAGGVACLLYLRHLRLRQALPA